jgi:outer membrane protein OmpA-like peptidoglycan-associated protein/ABC-type amino acid transport substrate-binding protein
MSFTVPNRPAIGLFALLAATASLAVAPVPGQAFDAVDSPPLSEVVEGTVRDCRADGAVRVPLITWGADIVTVHAAGGARTATGDSLLAAAGLEATLVRQDDFVDQIDAYLNCESPFLRATAGMANLAADVTEADPRTQMVAIYQHSWSAGGDAMVVTPGIDRPADLRGKRIAVQRYGPHIDYLLTILDDAGLRPDDVTLVWTRDLVGFGDSTPAAALAEGAADAAMVIIPDGLALTSDGTVGTGSEGSVKGAEILLSTKTANRVVADLYYVRRDFLEAAPEIVTDFTRALLLAEEATRGIIRTGGGPAQALFTQAADILLDDPGAIADAEAMWADAETVGLAGNLKFFEDPAFPRRFERLNEEAQAKYIALGMLSRIHPIASPPFDIASLGAGLDAGAASTERFDPDALAVTITRRQAQGALEDGTLFEFEVNFQPNQADFPIAVYREPFTRAIELAATYGGAVITVEGHADPLGYLRAKKNGQDDLYLTQIVQGARNLSYQRANEVRAGLIDLAGAEGIFMDQSQFVVLGHGFSDPKTGLCGDDPCAPKTEAEWLSNMRVSFRIIQVEAEAQVFVPLD